LGERELNVLYYCLMNVTVNPFIPVSVNGTLTWFNFVQYRGYLFINTVDARLARAERRIV
jgi:membrane protein DedA with SNARE-associated domain